MMFNNNIIHACDNTKPIYYRGDSKSMVNMKLIKFGMAMSMLSLLLFVLMAASGQEADANKLKDIGKKMEKIGDKMDNSVDCMKYNSHMMKKYMESGKHFYANPDCDKDEQWKYDRLNSGELSDSEMEALLKDEAYNNHDRKDKYELLEEDNFKESNIEIKGNDNDDDDERKSLKDIGNDIKNLF